ncbi:MAG: PQQ-binding-like beta-propeller repeat protein [Sedimentisphaerales bacterium]
MASRRLMSLILAFAVATGVQAGPQDWPAYAHTMSRQSIAVDGPDTIDSNTLEWVADTDPQDPSYYVKFEGATGAVVYNGRVYGYAEYYDESGEYTNSQIIAYDANSGEMLWATAIDQAEWDSWSTPCIDTKHNTVLIGSGNKVFALDAQSGMQRWATPLDQTVVNASVCVAADLPYARAFITGYDDMFGGMGKFYCINLDANEPNNPYQPGQVVWSQVIGNTSGNTAAYSNGVVYVASIGTDLRGYIHAYDATATNAVELWGFTNSDYEGFWGGVVVTKEGFLYAATYDFCGEEDNSTLFKIDCADGNIVWTIETERTDAMPIVIGDKIYICGGLAGYGRPKVEAYHDLGATVAKLWETPSEMIVGGWTNQPVYANGKLYVGAIPLGGDYYGSYTELYILDVSTGPNDANFIISHYADSNCGNSPAVTYDSIYTIGSNGLFKFHQPALLGDISRNNTVDMDDLAEFAENWLYDWPVGVSRSDLDLDGDVDFMDFSLLANEWRKELSGQ